MDYRSETFIQFIKKVKIKHLLFLNLGSIGILILFYFLYPNAFYSYLTFVFSWLIILNILTYGVSYRIYKMGRNAFLELRNKDQIMIKNVKLYIRGADIFDLESKFPPSFSKTIYEFTEADLIITEHSILLLGKENTIWNKQFAAPIELTNDNNVTSLTSVWINYWKESNKTLKLDVIDPNYKKSFQIEFRSHLDEIKEWLLSNKRIKQA